MALLQLCILYNSMLMHVRMQAAPCKMSFLFHWSRLLPWQTSEGSLMPGEHGVMDVRMCVCASHS